MSMDILIDRQVAKQKDFLPGVSPTYANENSYKQILCQKSTLPRGLQQL